jgi:N-dimethylarginine dimethylaminohydrolase
MAIKVMGEREIMREAKEILLEHMSLSKVARFWAMWQLGQGDYQMIREELFAGETVRTLYEKIRDYQQEAGSDDG